MKKMCVLRFLISISFIQGQEDQVVLSDLFGTWEIDRTEDDTDFEIIIYKRYKYNHRSTVYRFLTNGNFNKYYDYELANKQGIHRCGNTQAIAKYVNPKPERGTYRFNEVSQQIKFKYQLTGKKDTWNLFWISKNSFGVYKAKPKT